jgi:DNA-binding GntR family transcriptional regulator
VQKTVQDTKALNAEAVVQTHADLERDIRNGQKAIADKMQAIMNALNAGDKETAERLLQELEKDLKKQAVRPPALLSSCISYAAPGTVA